VDSRFRDRIDEAVICISHSWGGLEQVAASDAIERARLGLKVRMVCLQNTPIHEYLQKHSEVSVEILESRPRDHFDFGLRREIKRLIADGVNIFHTHQTTLLGSMAPWLWSEQKVGLFASRHILNGHDKHDLFHRAIYGRLDGLIVMSQMLRKNVLATHPIRDRRVKVVNLGLDFDAFDPRRVDGQAQRKAWGADPETLVIGLVGRIDPAKGQSTLIKAAANVVRHYQGRLDTQDLKLKFVMVGEETLGSTANHLAELQDLIQQLRISDSIVFAGYQQDIPEIMRAFDILVMPSRQEAFGLVAIEAMAMECPIVISRGGSASEIVGQEEYGLLVAPEDAFDLQMKLRNLIDHPELRRQMGVRAREHVKRNYDRVVRREKTLELYERTLRARLRGSV
jgi:glycosyltransferase involved in cell wall biosynthesis